MKATFGFAVTALLFTVSACTPKENEPALCSQETVSTYNQIKIENVTSLYSQSFEKLNQQCHALKVHLGGGSCLAERARSGEKLSISYSSVLADCEQAPKKKAVSPYEFDEQLIEVTQASFEIQFADQTAFKSLMEKDLILQSGQLVERTLAQGDQTQCEFVKLSSFEKENLSFDDGLRLKFFTQYFAANEANESDKVSVVVFNAQDGLEIKCTTKSTTAILTLSELRKTFGATADVQQLTGSDE